MNARVRHVQLLYEVRRAHLERQDHRPDSTILYLNTNYDLTDFDLDAYERAARAVPGAVIRAIFNSKAPLAVEVNEPLMVRGLGLALIGLLLARVRRYILGRPTTVVCYAIENGDVRRSITERHGRWAWRAFSLLSRGVMKRMDRVAFGTESASQCYMEQLGASAKAMRLVAPLEPRCGECDPLGSDPRVLFVGSFEPRKGVLELLAAWEAKQVDQDDPVVELVLMGQGPLAEQVRDWAGPRTDVTIVSAPSPAQIHQFQARAKVLVLLSQATASWREQVGLPILEGLSHGCEIVTTRETGLAAWLLSNGHQVIAESGVDDVLEALNRALLAQRGPEEIVSALPLVSGRAAAQNWMLNEE